jgi:HK97 family phage prohead protease
MSNVVHTPGLIEFKRESLTPSGEFEGYASTFGNVDAVGDIIEAGAFAPALEYHRKEQTMPAMLWSHNTSEPIGRWLHFHEDDHGLVARGRLTLSTRRGKEAYELMKDNACFLSVAFRIAPKGAEMRGDNRIIHRIESLLEVSVVAIPANSRARILNLKDSPRNLERFLRDAGVPNAAAKQITRGGFNALAHRDDGNWRETELSRVNLQRRTSALKPFSSISALRNNPDEYRRTDRRHTEPHLTGAGTHHAAPSGRVPGQCGHQVRGA